MDDSYYTDAELESATGLPLIHVRRLITWGAVSPAKGGKGVVRQWDQHAIRHIACVKALYVAGLSLPMAHTLGMLMPIRDDHERQGLRAPEFEIDPGDILTDVWDRTVSLSARAQNRLNATSLALDHLRQQLTREVTELEKLLAANPNIRALRRDLEFLRQMLRRL
jgi:hypothetical protein